MKFAYSTRDIEFGTLKCILDISFDWTRENKDESITLVSLEKKWFSAKSAPQVTEYTNQHFAAISQMFTDGTTDCNYWKLVVQIMLEG